MPKSQGPEAGAFTLLIAASLVRPAAPATPVPHPAAAPLNENVGPAAGASFVHLALNAGDARPPFQSTAPTEPGELAGPPGFEGASTSLGVALGSEASRATFPFLVGGALSGIAAVPAPPPATIEPPAAPADSRPTAGGFGAIAPAAAWIAASPAPAFGLVSAAALNSTADGKHSGTSPTQSAGASAPATGIVGALSQTSAATGGKVSIDGGTVESSVAATQRFWRAGTLAPVMPGEVDMHTRAKTLSGRPSAEPQLPWTTSPSGMAPTADTPSGQPSSAAEAIQPMTPNLSDAPAASTLQPERVFARAKAGADHSTPPQNVPGIEPLAAQSVGPSAAPPLPPPAVVGPSSAPAFVATAISTAAPHPPETAAVPIEGIAVEIAARMREGKRRFEVRLDPPELGRIDVRLDVSRDGQVTSRLVVERAETLDLLRRDAGTLERALQGAGLRPDDGGLQFSLRDQSSQRWGTDDQPARPNVLILPDEDVAVRDAVRRAYDVLRGVGRGVDISV